MTPAAARRPHRRGVPGRAEEACGVHGDAARHGDGRDGRRDLGRITRPADDGQAHRQIVEAQHGQQGDPRDGVGAERVRADHPRQHDPDPDRAQLAQRIADEGPAKCPGCRGRQGGLLGRPGAARGPHVPSPRGTETDAGPMLRAAGPGASAAAAHPRAARQSRTSAVGPKRRTSVVHLKCRTSVVGLKCRTSVVGLKCGILNEGLYCGILTRGRSGPRVVGGYGRRPGRDHASASFCIPRAPYAGGAI